MDKINPLFTATATAIGGRNGHTETSDGAIKADLSLPKALGGRGKPGLATPEHLFAAGYAACFGGALDFVAKQKKRDATKAKITCAVSIGPREGGGFGIAVSRCGSRTGALRKPNLTHWSAKLTKKSAPIHMLPGATWRLRSK
jgi:lipoyl-dependent peroxiredoxin